VRRSVAAERAEAEASAADLAVAQVTVVSELAATYFELRGAQERLRVARANAENQRDSLELVRVRLEHGRGTEFDTARARAQLESTLARIPALEAETAVAMHRIAVLTGRDTAAVVAELSQPQELPTVTQPISAGAPGDLLRRRPDVAAAERRLAAATARIGVATADLFPRFTLGGLIGTQAVDTADLFEGSSEQRLVMLGIDWSFLDVGRVRARIAAADADASADLARYEQTVLRAIEETENALVRYARSRAERNHRAEAAQAGAQAAGLARRRFEGGIVDFLEVLDAERSQLEAEDELAQSRTRSATSLVALYRSLAGGWPDRTPGGV
jgi:NodT family efflux transporter outer membrane factor (OMF) lipoprotein